MKGMSNVGSWTSFVGAKHERIDICEKRNGYIRSCFAQRGAIAPQTKKPILGVASFVTFYVLFLTAFTALAQEAPVQLRLEAEKQVLVRNEQGQEQVNWQNLKEKAQVQPGDVIRYVLGASGTDGDRPIKNFALTQPIPKQTTYIINSATGNKARITYSIDNAKSFVDNPTIEVRLAGGKVERQPAPASSYTHIRWRFSEAIAPSEVKASYQVRVSF